MNKPLKPFLKWPGGKRWLVPQIRALLHDQPIARYFEPFLGGGAVFFGLRPEQAILSDVNADLINTYCQVRDRSQDIIEQLQQMPVTKEAYLTIRASELVSPLERAVRFLYLNRTAFGGMYRLDRQGHFNVPFGGGQRTPAPLWRDNLLANAAQALQGAQLVTADFEDMIADAGLGDVVYCDPTYTVAHNNNGFIRYNEKNFSWSDQQRLAQACQAAYERGAIVIVSNACHAEILAFYHAASILTVERKSLICPNPEMRRPITEYLILLQPAGQIASLPHRSN